MSIQETISKVVPPSVPPKPGTLTINIEIHTRDKHSHGKHHSKLYCLVVQLLQWYQLLKKYWLKKNVFISMTHVSIHTSAIQSQSISHSCHLFARFTTINESNFICSMLLNMCVQWKRKKTTQIPQLFRRHVGFSISSFHLRLHPLLAEWLKLLLLFFLCPLEVEKKPSTVRIAIMPPTAAPRKFTHSANSSTNSDPKTATNMGPMRLSKSTSALASVELILLVILLYSHSVYLII